MDVSDRAIDHVELYVGDALVAAHYYCSTYGFRLAAEAGPDTGLPGGRSLLLVHGGVNLVLTSSLHGDHGAARFVRKHGDGVHDLAIATPDAAGDFARAVAAGAEPVARPATFEDDGGRVVIATVASVNDLVHSFVQRDDPTGPFWPGRFVPVPGGPAPGPRVLASVDHVALCLRPGSLTTMVAFYEHTLGLHEFYDEYIRVGGQAMDSRAVQSEGGGVTITMVEPDPRFLRGQLDDFLDRFDGPGVQHLAFATHDIVGAARELRRTGVELLPTAATYYDGLAARGIDVDVPVAAMRELGLLVDRDAWGHLVQVFTRSPYARRTLFFELIQRMDARTFGSGNIRALYEAVERERASDGADRVLVPAAAR